MHPISEVLASGEGTAARCLVSCGSEVWTGDRDGGIIIRDMSSGKEVGRWRCKAASVWAMAESQGRVWCGMSDGHIQVFRGGAKRKGTAHKAEITPPASINYTSGALCLTTTNDSVIVGYGCSAIARYDSRTLELTSIYKTPISPTRCLAAHHHLVFAGSTDSHITVLDSLSLRKTHSWRVASSPIQAISVSRCGRDLWCGTSTGDLYVYTSEGTKLHRIPAPPTAHPHGAAVASILRVHETVWVASWDGRVEVYSDKSPDYPALDALVPAPGCGPKRDRGAAASASKIADEAAGSVIACSTVSTQLQVAVWLSSADNALHRVTYAAGYSLEKATADTEDMMDMMERVNASHLQAQHDARREAGELREALEQAATDLVKQQQALRIAGCERDRYREAAHEALVLLGACDDASTVSPLDAMHEVKLAGAQLKDYVTDLTAECETLRTELDATQRLLSETRQEVAAKTQSHDEWRKQARQNGAQSKALEAQLGHRKARACRAAVRVLLTGVAKQSYLTCFGRWRRYAAVRGVARKALGGVRRGAEVALLQQGYRALLLHSRACLARRAQQVLHAVTSEAAALEMSQRLLSPASASPAALHLVQSFASSATSAFDAPSPVAYRDAVDRTPPSRHSLAGGSPLSRPAGAVPLTPPTGNSPRPAGAWHVGQQQQQQQGPPPHSGARRASAPAWGPPRGSVGSPVPPVAPCGADAPPAVLPAMAPLPRSPAEEERFAQQQQQQPWGGDANLGTLASPTSPSSEGLSSRHGTPGLHALQLGGATPSQAPPGAVLLAGGESSSPRSVLRRAAVLKLAAVVLSGTRSYVLCWTWCALGRHAVWRKKIRRELCMVASLLRSIDGGLRARCYSKLWRYPRMRQRQRAKRSSAWKLAQYTAEESRRMVFNDWRKWSSANVTAKGSRLLEARRKTIIEALRKLVQWHTLHRFFNVLLRFRLMCSQSSTLKELHAGLLHIQSVNATNELDPLQVRGFILTTREQMLVKLFEQHSILTRQQTCKKLPPSAEARVNFMTEQVHDVKKLNTWVLENLVTNSEKLSLGYTITAPLSPLTSPTRIRA